jgi:hypothetical protein
MTPASPLQHDYATGDVAQAGFITPHEDVVLDEVTVLGSEAAGGTDVLAISARNCRRLQLHRVRVRDFEDVGVMIAGCHSTRLEDCEITNGASSARGLMISHACSDIVVDGLRVTDVPVGVSLEANANWTASGLGVGAGQVRRVRLQDLSFDGCASAIATDADVAFLTIDGVRARGCSSVMAIACPTVEIRNIWGEKGAVNLLPEVPNKAGRGYQLSVSDVRLLNGAFAVAPTHIAAGSGILELIDLQRVRCSAGNISVVLDNANDPVITRLDLLDCHAGAGLTVTAFSSVAISSLSVSGGRFDGASVITDVTRLAFTGPEFINAAGVGLLITQPNTAFTACGASNIRVSGTDDGMKVDCTTGTCFNLTIAGGYIEGSGGAGEYPLDITGVLSQFSIDGAVVRRTNDTDSCIHMAGTASGNIDVGVVADCVIVNGTYGIEVTNGGTEVRFDSCVFDSILTDTVLGNVWPSDGLLYNGCNAGTADSPGASFETLTGSSYTTPDVMKVGDIIRVRAAVLVINASGGPKDISAKLLIGGIDVTDATISTESLPDTDSAVITFDAQFAIHDLSGPNQHSIRCETIWGEDTGTPGNDARNTAANPDLHKLFLETTVSGFTSPPQILVQGIGNTGPTMRIIGMTVELLRAPFFGFTT